LLPTAFVEDLYFPVALLYVHRNSWLFFYDLSGIDKYTINVVSSFFELEEIWLLGFALAGVASPMCQISAAIHEHHKKQLWRESVRVGRGISKNTKRKLSAY